MLEIRGNLYLGEESFYAEHRPELGVEQLEGDVPVVAKVTRVVYGGLTAGSDLPLDVVAFGERRFELR